MVISHGRGARIETDQYIFLTEEFQKSGYSAYIFDHRGHGESESLTQVYQISFDDTAPFTPIYTSETIAAYKDNISGIFFSPDGMNDFTRTMKK